MNDTPEDKPNDDATPSDATENTAAPHTEPAVSTGDDALADVESILNEAGANLDADQDGAGDALTKAANMAAEHLEDLRRLQAEFVNYRKRVDRDRAVLGDQAQAKVIESLIPALDDIAAAREHGDLTEGPFASIATKLEESLGRLGWEPYGAVGDEFDPQIHEALMSQPSAEVSVPTVQQVAQPGHRIGDKVLRPARVIVAQPE
ncbi:nucleotide exchange factor GrpE [Demequina aurantiaca]|uniref:nucleotide exchange factor GrpE n=1 Tax=Demequina aurantiaca TaxID=676200 RepID=UPI00078335F7|nr:nucleotide exchange factor GrpE [Demequina aurantiaca]